MGAGEGDPAVARIGRQPLLLVALHFVGGLPVAELADVEVVRTPEAVDPQPAEEPVARSLHQPLTRDHPLALLLDGASLGIALQHRGLSFLHLEEQCVVVAQPDVEDHERLRPDGADADDLARVVGERVRVDDRLHVPAERPAVCRESVSEGGVAFGRGIVANDERRICPDPPAGVGVLGETAQRAEVRSRRGLLDGPVCDLLGPG